MSAPDDSPTSSGFRCATICQRRAGRGAGWSSVRLRRISALVVTYNPDIQRFSKVLSAASMASDSVIIIDNNSVNFEEIRKAGFDLFRSGKLEYLNLERNYGIGAALNAGIKKCLSKEEPDFVLTLDQDSIIQISRDEMQNYLNQGISLLGNRFGALSLSHTGLPQSPGDLIPINYGIISGMVVETGLFKEGLRYREEFFLDQVDLDFSFEIIRKGKEIISTKAKELDHELGTTVNRFGRNISVESDWRLYLLIRNSTILLREGKINTKFYLYQAFRQIGQRLLALKIRDNAKLPMVAVKGLHDGIFKDFEDNFKFGPGP